MRIGLQPKDNYNSRKHDNLKIYYRIIIYKNVKDE